MRNNSHWNTEPKGVWHFLRNKKIKYLLNIKSNKKNIKAENFYFILFFVTMYGLSSFGIKLKSEHSIEI